MVLLYIHQGSTAEIHIPITMLPAVGMLKMCRQSVVLLCKMPCEAFGATRVVCCILPLLCVTMVAARPGRRDHLPGRAVQHLLPQPAALPGLRQPARPGAHT